MKSFVFLLLFVPALAFISSCSDNVSNSLEPVDIISGINASEFFSDKPVLSMINDSLVNSADGILISWLKTTVLQNKEHVPPQTSAYIRAYFRYPSQVSSVHFGPANLMLDQVVAFPRYRTPFGWSEDSYTYNDTATWNINFTSGQAYNSLVTFQEPVFLLDINSGDTFHLAKSYNMTWNPPADKNTKMWLSFSWTPSGTTKEQFIKGYEIVDDGNYTFNQNELTNLGINKSGYLVVNLLRYSVSQPEYADGKKLVKLNMTDARVSVHTEL